MDDSKLYPRAPIAASALSEPIIHQKDRAARVARIFYTIMQDTSTQTRLEKTLAHYVAMQTLPDNIAICRSSLQEISLEFEKQGMVTQLDGPVHPWLIATTSADAMRKKHVKVLFVIHLDVVPGANEAQFDVHITKDRIYGRGVYDMKFAAACVKEMITDFAKENTLQSFDFGVLITTDEEKGGQDGVGNFLTHDWSCDIAIVPDGGWNWSLEARAKGFIYIYLTSNGRSAHSSRPWTGDNPISRLSPAIDQITKQFPNTDQYGTIVSVNSVESSTSGIYHTTQIPNWAKAGISVRAYTEEEMSDAVAIIQKIAAEHSVETSVTLHDPPVTLMKENPLVQEFIATATRVHGQPIKFSDALASSDARYLARYNIPTVVMYPDGGDHHGPGEWLLRTDLYKYFTLCKTFVEKVAQTGPTATKTSRLRKLLTPLNRR